MNLSEIMNATVVNNKTTAATIDPLWVACQSANLFYLGVGGYLATSLHCWGRQFRRPSPHGGGRKQEVTTLIDLALACVAWSLATFVLGQAQLILDVSGAATDRSCEALMDCLIVVYSIAYILPYIFLWLRVRKLYHQECLKQLDTRPVCFFSWLTLFFIVAGGVFHLCEVTVPRNHIATPHGCKQIKIMDWVTYLAHAIKILTQAILFGLICYPLRRCSAWTSSNMSRHSTVGVRTRQILLRSIRFAFVSLISCVASDLLISVVDSELLPNIAPCSLINLIWNINLLINVASITLCFDGFRKNFINRIFGWRIRHDSVVVSQAADPAPRAGGAGEARKILVARDQRL